MTETLVYSGNTRETTLDDQTQEAFGAAASELTAFLLFLCGGNKNDIVLTVNDQNVKTLCPGLLLITESSQFAASSAAQMNFSAIIVS